MNLIVIFIIIILIYAYYKLENNYQICKIGKRKIKKIKTNIFDDNNLKIGIDQAKNMIKNREFDFIIDVRPDKSWIMSHHVDAIHIELSRLESILPNKILNKRNKILVYANSKQIAESAAMLIKKLGYKKVKFIENKFTDLY
jgi:rhodanese-related sulfurtransferase